ncbi:hypothetical protein ACWGQ9_13330, partial [Streptomyces parvus]
MNPPTATTAEADVTEAPPDDPTVHILWINAGLSCDGDSVSLTAATQPSIEELALGALPGLPKVAVHWPLIDYECGPVEGAGNFVEWFFKADRGELEPFVLVVEGSIPNERIKPEGYWCGFGDDPETGQPITTSEWLDRLTPGGGRPPGPRDRRQRLLLPRPRPPVRRQRGQARRLRAPPPPPPAAGAPAPGGGGAAARPA